MAIKLIASPVISKPFLNIFIRMKVIIMLFAKHAMLAFVNGLQNSNVQKVVHVVLKLNLLV